MVEDDAVGLREMRGEFVNAQNCVNSLRFLGSDVGVVYYVLCMLCTTGLVLFLIEQRVALFRGFERFQWRPHCLSIH